MSWTSAVSRRTPGPAATLLKFSDAELEARDAARDQFEQRVNDMMSSENPLDRLALIEMFLNMDHRDPLTQAVAGILCPILDLPLKNEPDARKGDVARALKLSAGYPRKGVTPTQLVAAHAEFYREAVTRLEGESPTWDAAIMWAVKRTGSKGVNVESVERVVKRARARGGQ